MIRHEGFTKPLITFDSRPNFLATMNFSFSSEAFSKEKLSVSYSEKKGSDFSMVLIKTKIRTF